MGSQTSNLARFAVALAVTVTAAPPAYADLVVGPDGTRQPIERHRALLVHQGPQTTIVEEVYARSTVRRGLWIKAFHKAPTFAEAPADPFDTIAEATDVKRPHNRALRARVFGPSVVTLLGQKLFRDTAEPPEPEPPVRDARLQERALFSGSVYTSTITGQWTLPAKMQTWLRSRGYELQGRTRADLAAHLNSGAVVALTIFDDASPTSEGLARLGPVKVTVEGPQPSLPLVRRTDPGAGLAKYELFVAGSGPLVPSAYGTLWDEEPWEAKALGRGQFHTRYAHPLSEVDAVRLDVEQRLGIEVPTPGHLVRSEFRQGSEALGEIAFEPGKYVVQIPSRGRHGDGWDLFLCILLGLTPLIYTPESWFLLWLGARARESARTGGGGFGRRLWPLYALVVAAYWGVTLEGAARLAAVLPLLLSIVMLTLPDTLRAENRVRVDFAKGKKKKS